MSLQVLTLKLDGITAGDYLAWCRDPDPPALGFALRSICVDADPLGDTITAILEWDQPAPAAPAAASAAGLPLAAGVQIHPLPTTGVQMTSTLSCDITRQMPHSVCKPTVREEEPHQRDLAVL